MNKLTINRENGNVPKSLAGQDHVSGMIFYVPAEGDIPSGFSASAIKAMSTIESAEASGITSDADSWAVRVMHYQLSEIFRVNDGVSLYVGVFVCPASHTFNEVVQLQNFAAGAVRQIGIWDGSTEVTSEVVGKLQAKGDALDKQNMPVSILYAPKVTDHASLPKNLAVSSPRVSVVIAQDGSGTGASLYADDDNEDKNTVSAIGIALGHVSKAAVHQSISWVANFPSGISLAAMGDGVLVRDIDQAVLEGLDTARYLFLMSHVGIAGTYWNDSHNMDAAISDYSSIESVRTMDKACRGIRVYLVPELGGNVYIDKSTGQLASASCVHLESMANKALEDMEKAGELSGYVALIDPEQDIVSTSSVEVVIKNVPVGVMRKMNIKIGYVKKID